MEKTTKKKTTGKRLYLIPVLTKALDILELLQVENRPMVLEQIHKQTKISKTTVYRILKTLVHRGYVGLTADREYRHIAQPKKLRFGFGGQSAEMPFSQAVTASLRDAAVAVGVDLIVKDNCYNAEVAVKNAEAFVRDRVDVIIEFQVEQQAAPIIADKIAEAEIPLIAVDIPHPHATYFGVNNYRAGLAAGVVLAEYAELHWEGKAEFVLGFDLEEAGPMVQSRITGAFEGIRERLPKLGAECFIRVDGRGMGDASYTVMMDFLKKHPKAKRMLIASANDSSALGVIKALRETGRERQAVVVGQDCLEEMVVEMGRAGSPAIASVSHQVNQYGPRLIELGLALLRGEKVAPYHYIDHKVVTAVRSDRAGRFDGGVKAPARTSAKKKIAGGTARRRNAKA